MTDARKIVLFGFPVMLGLLALGVFDLAAGRVRAEKENARSESRERLESLLERGNEIVKRLEKENTEEHEQVKKEARELATRTAERASGMLCAAAVRLEAENLVRRERSNSTAAQFLSLFAPPEKEMPVASEPISLIAQFEENLLEMSAENTRIRILSESGRVLWKSPEYTDANTEKAESRCSFSWQGRPVAWTIEARAIEPELKNRLDPENVRLTFMEDALMQRELGGKFCLALLDRTGTPQLMLPAKSYKIDAFSEGDLGRWVETNPGAYSGHTIKLLLTKHAGATDRTLAAQAMIFEDDFTALAWRELNLRPGLLVVPLAGLVVAIAAVFAAFSGSDKREQTDEPDLEPVLAESAPLNPPPGRRLVKKSSESHSHEEAALVLADLGSEDGEVKVKKIREPVKRDSLSSLERLRRLHCPDGTYFDITSQVRSPVLRELLREVGRRTPQNRTEDALKNFAPHRNKVHK